MAGDLPRAYADDEGVIGCTRGGCAPPDFRLQRVRAGDEEELASQARHWMDAPIRIVRLRETWSGVCSDANGVGSTAAPAVVCRALAANLWRTNIRRCANTRAQMPTTRASSAAPGGGRAPQFAPTGLRQSVQRWSEATKVYAHKTSRSSLQLRDTLSLLGYITGQ
jgi:hypothetical protein